MGVYTRFKRDPSGFRALVELLESTPASRRQKMIDVGMAEDPEYTESALKYVYTFEDVVSLPDMELAEVLAVSPPRVTGMAIQPLGEDVKQRFLKNAKPPIASQFREFFDMKFGLSEVGGAQLKLITFVRQLEKKGLIKTKRIPAGGP